MFEIPGSRKGYYQWDLNQRLYVRDSSCNEVHFCSEKYPESLTCQVQEESGKRYVQVPNILLQSCLPITAFAYVKGAEEAYTKRSLCIEIWERPKPNDYVYTETEVKTWESAVEYALQEAKESGAFKGDQGEKGDKGDTGEQGPQGEKGEKGDGFLTEADKLGLAIHCTGEGAEIKLKDASELPLAGLKIFGKTTQDGTPTPDAPIDLVSAGDGGSIVVTVAGKNLLRSTAVTKTMNGVTCTVNDDGSITLDGAATTPFQLVLNSKLTLPKGKFILSGCPSGGSDTTYDLRYGAKGEYRDMGEGVRFELADTTTAVVGIMLRSGVQLSGLTFYPMIRPETESDGYVPYAGQILEITTPDGFPGIPVPIGGNYTDESGQQWICDEIDFARGVYVQRIGQYTFTGEEEIVVYGSTNAVGFCRWQVKLPLDSAFTDKAYAVNSLCDKYTASTANVLAGLINGGETGYHFTFAEKKDVVFSTDRTELDAFKAEIAGTTLLYQLSAPIETALSEEEIYGYAALCTHKPNTAVYNDSGVWMQVSYAADTKAYIDSKFAELAAVILNNT